MKYPLIVAFLLVSVILFAQNSDKVKVGDKAKDFTLKSIRETELELSKLNHKNPVVLIVLRGWPDYQCPVCSRQVGQFLAEAEKFKNHNASVLFVYPGPSEVLQEKAKEFTEDFNFPDNFYFLLDPDYSMINKYALRWDAPKETAYPSTFVINKKGKIVYSKISSSHRGRAEVNEVLEELEKL